MHTLDSGARRSRTTSALRTYREAPYRRIAGSAGRVPTLEKAIGRRAFRRALPVLLATAGVSCGTPAMSITISNRADLDDAVYDLIETYLVGDFDFGRVQATRFCPDDSEAECLVRVEAVTPVDQGPARTLLLFFTTGETFPGPADLSSVARSDWGVDPAVFAATEAVGHDDVARTYDFDCRYADGNLDIDQALDVSGPISGHFDLVLSCRAQLLPGQPGEIGVTGSFSTTLQDAIYPW